MPDAALAFSRWGSRPEAADGAVQSPWRALGCLRDVLLPRAGAPWLVSGALAGLTSRDREPQRLEIGARGAKMQDSIATNGQRRRASGSGRRNACP